MNGVVARAWRGIQENRYLSFVSTGVIAAALALLGVFALGILNMRAVLVAWEQDAHISAYVAKDLAAPEAEALRAKIAALPQVETVTWVSEAEARAWLGTQVPELAPSMGDLARGTLPPSMEITLRSGAVRPEALEPFVRTLRGLGPWTEIDYGQEWVARIATFVSMLTVMGTMLGVLIAVASVFLVANTVHLVIFSRRDELAIMRLVGATDGYILGPFVAEGVLQGLVGGLVALGGLRAVYGGVLGRLRDALGPALGHDALRFLPPGWCGALVLGGVLVGGLASYGAVRRFLGSLP